MNEFKNYHPIVNFTYFIAVMVFSMIFMHPICIVISFLSAFAYSFILIGKNAIKFNLFYMLPLIIGAAIINAAFNHEGVTIIEYLPSGNPLTLESVIYGLASSFMLAEVIVWFSCFNKVITSDKFIYLFGRIIPSLSLVLSMSLRFVPEFRRHIQKVSEAQKGIGRDISSGNIITRMKNGLKVLSATITWSLENAIDTADSMKSRGYGLPKRTAYSNYTLEKRDIIMLSYIVFLTVFTAAGAFSGKISFVYYPAVKYAEMSIFGISVFTAYLLLCIMPIGLELTEEIKWRKLKSKI